MAKRPSLAASMKAVGQAPVHVISEASPPPPVEAQGRGYRAATREGMKKATALLTPEDHRRLKRLSVDTGESIEKLMLSAVHALLAKHGA